MDIRFSHSNMILAVKGNGASCFLFCVAHEFGEGKSRAFDSKCLFPVKNV